jgi:hypothetical protein
MVVLGIADPDSSDPVFYIQEEETMKTLTVMFIY